MKKIIPLFFSAIIVELGSALLLWGLGSLLTLILNAYVGTAILYLPFWAYLVAVFIIIVINDLLHINRLLSDSLKRMKAMEAMEDIAKEAKRHMGAENEYNVYDHTDTDEDDE